MKNGTSSSPFFSVPIRGATKANMPNGILLTPCYTWSKAGFSGACCENVDLEEETRDQVKAMQQHLEDCRQLLTGRLNEVEEFARRSESLSDRLYREVVASRMRPFADGIQGFPRLVRDIARQLGKQAKLEIIGRTTEVDRDMLEKLEAPLNHLLRNALDHGLEAPDERLAAGKDLVRAPYASKPGTWRACSPSASATTAAASTWNACTPRWYGRIWPARKWPSN